MEESILDSIKKLLGIDPEYDVYDHDIILHINSVFSVLHQIGASPPERAYRITGNTETWGMFVLGLENVDVVKTYVYLRVRLIFDPPATSFAIDAVKSQIQEFEWRLQKLENVFNPLGISETTTYPTHLHSLEDIEGLLDAVTQLVADLLSTEGAASAADLAAEASTRASADSALDARVDALEAAPGPDLSGYATDAELAAAISSEASTRASADTALDARVDALEAASGPDLSGYATDAELAAAISSEASTRASADTALDARLDTLEAIDHSGFATDAELASEASTRASADTALDARLDTLEAIDHSGFATDAELASEASTRASADNALDARLDTLEAAPPSHTHSIANVTGLQTALDTKVASTTIDDIVVLTQSAYDALSPKVSATLYVIVG